MSVFGSDPGNDPDRPFRAVSAQRAGSMGELLCSASGQLARVDGVETLAGIAHIDADSGAGAWCWTSVRGQGLWFPIRIRSARH